MLVRKGQKSLNDFKFGTFIGRFSSDGAANMAAKVLISFKSTLQISFKSL